MDTILNRVVAIKILRGDLADDPMTLLRFQREASAASKLSHPNVVDVYDVGESEGKHYIVMEYVEGITLKTYIEKKGQLSFKEAVSIAIQVARGIEAAHNKQIIHRDIKPQNIMISTEGKVKVMDFGIARAASSNTVSSDVMGSVHYSSPEQARNGFVDGRSDIYSLGIVMYEMVTGRVPFDGDTTVAVAIQHLQEEMTPPSVYAKNLPISMEKIILKCTQKNADRRYQTIGDLLADLRRSLVHPDEDFVVIAPLVDNGKTKVISGEELKQIKEHGVEPKEDRHASKLESSYDPDEDEDDEDEDENEGLSPKMDKAMTIMGIVVFVVILAVIIYLVGSFFGLFRFGSNSSKNTETQTQTQTQTQTESEQPVVVQNVCGKLQEEAQSELEAQGLYMFVIQEQKSDQPEGTVLNQDPVGGSEVSAGTTINVIVAGTENVDFTDSESQSEQNDVPVPNVVGKLEKDASSTLSAAGFKVSKTYKYDDSVDAGKVVSQSPRGGNAQKGSTVTIVISQGKKSSTVPSVQGRSKKDAQAALQKAGLKVAVKEEYSDSVKAGQVISQSVASGKIVPADTTVTITVSKGPEEINYSYKFSKSYAAPEGAVSATYTLTGSDGTTYASGTSDVDGSLTIGASDMACESGKVTISWSIEKIDDEGLSDTSTKTETHSVSFSKQ